MAKVIGITGPISSGKSTLSNYLKQKGYKIFDADLEVKNIYQDENFLIKLKNDFPDVFINNVFDKSQLSKIIFFDKEKKVKLENLTHPIVEKKCDDFIKKFNQEKNIFIDVPLLFEVNWDKKCDEIILLTIEKSLQKERYVNRGGKLDLFEKIIKNQNDIESKISKSTYTINNNGTLKDFYTKIDSILNKIN